MTLSRLLILTTGPFVVVAIAWLIAAPHPAGTVSARAADHSTTPRPKDDTRAGSLAERCQRAVTELRCSLPGDFQLVQRGPFLIAGDLPSKRLQGLYADVVGPVSHALTATYFDRQPTQPITIVVCSTETRFRQLAREWDGHLETGYHGYYQRDKRRILLDLEAGNGSLAHELTHALSQSDCEDLPEWFDEGLGALHEEATFADGGRHLIGLPNWRCRLSRQAAKSGHVPSLATLTDPDEFRTGDVGLNYALSRSICLFLQDRGKLVAFYKALRERAGEDRRGLKTLCRVIEVKSAAEADRQFVAWLKKG